MTKFILGKKLGMTTIYGNNNEALNVTLIECVPNKVSLIRNEKKDGYEGFQVEMPKTKNKNIKKECRGVIADLKIGDEIKTDIFEVGEKVSVSGKTKAKGFQGVVKRHGFGGAPKSHGHKHDLRAPGSIGSGFPEHVVKGKRMAGRMGGVRSTSKNLKIAYINKEKNIIGVQGSAPGVDGGVVEIFLKS